MAISKIWPLYQTIGKAVKYICNYEKTEDGTLITSYKCTERFADHEFHDIEAKARKVKKPRIGYHMIISFSPEDEITASKALELGKKIVDEYTGGKYQYVLSVHTDQKHIHVHCVMNSVSIHDYKKLQIADKELDKLEKITDKVCRENNLSVIENKKGIKGRGKYEHEKHLNGDSWKDTIRELIDKNILRALDYDDFIQRMQMEEGCEIKQGKYLSFRLPGQVKFTRNRSLGEFYSVEKIKERILYKEKFAEQFQESKKSVQNDKRSKHIFFRDESLLFDGKIQGIVDVEKNAKAQKYTAYRKKLNLININSYAGMMSFVRRYHIVYRDDFDKAREELETKSNKITADIKKAFKELNQLEADSHQIQKYLENMQAHKRYTQTNDKNEKYDLNDANRNYESAVVYIEKNDIRAADITYANLDKINTRIEVLYQKIDELKDSRKSTREDIRRLDIIRKNNEEIFGKEITRPVSKEQDKEAQSQR